MTDIVHKIFTEITGFVTAVVVLIVHGEVMLKKLGLDTYIKRSLIERRHTMSLLTVINGVELAEKDALALSTFLLKVPEYAPVLQKQFADLQKAEADKNDPVALMADTSVLLGDLNTDFTVIVPFITNLIPALKTGSTIPTPPVPPAA